MAEETRPNEPKIVWDDSKMNSTYANVCNVTGSREEMVFFFGISNPATTGEPEVRVQLSDRIILSPFAAKRLSVLLNNALSQYEAKFGSLNVTGATPAPGNTN